MLISIYFVVILIIVIAALAFFFSHSSLSLDYIADCSHTADLDSINFNDSVEMNVAKLKVAAFLRSVLRRAAN